MSDERRSGTTPLRGKPLDEDGAIAFEPQPRKVEILVLNATALEPTKVYLIEVDRAKVSEEQTFLLSQNLQTFGVKGLVIRTIGGDGIQVRSAPTMEPEA